MGENLEEKIKELPIEEVENLYLYGKKEESVIAYHELERRIATKELDSKARLEVLSSKTLEQVEERGKELFDELMGILEEDVSVLDSIQTWIDDELFRLFDHDLESYSKTTSKEEESTILEKLREQHAPFFEEVTNTIYLKLLALYMKVTGKDGKEDPELYETAERFEPNEYELSKVLKTLEGLKRGIAIPSVATVFETGQIYETVLGQYQEAYYYGQTKRKTVPEEDAEDMDRILDALEATLTLYTKGYTLQMLEENRGDEMQDRVLESETVGSLATLYSDIEGLQLSPLEVKTLSSELTAEQKETLFAAMKK